MRKLLLVGLALCLGSGAAHAQSRELIQLQADVVTLTQRVSEIQRSLDQRDTGVSRLVEQLLDRVATLSGTVERMSQSFSEVRADNSALTGEMRVLMSNLRQDVEVVDRNVKDLRAEMTVLSQRLTSLNTTSSDLGGSSNSADQMLRLAESDFLTGNYDLAVEGFREYIDQFPNSPGAVEAQLYLGNAYFNQVAYEQAIIEYDLLLQKYPQSDRTVSALYKKGLAQAAIGQTSQALDTLRRVVSQFPDSSEATNAADEIRRLGGA